MRAVIQAAFVCLMLALLSVRLQRRLRRWFHRRLWRILLVPSGAVLLFCAVLAAGGGLTPGFVLLLSAYAFAAALVVCWSAAKGGSFPADMAAVALLWLPVEFTVGKNLLPAAVHGLANDTAQGVALALALLLLVVCREWPGAKYNWPSRSTDWLYPAVGFVAAVLVLAPVAWALHFIGTFRVPEGFGAAGFLRLFLVILVGVALPEELLFRSLIQSRLMQRFGRSQPTLLLAALIFGAAHLNNGPGSLPNWRYMLLAFLAGILYGAVFERASSVLSSACLHAVVNAVRHAFFG